MRRRLIYTMSFFCLIALLAFFTLDGNLRYAVWIAMAFFALKTYIAYKTHQ